MNPGPEVRRRLHLEMLVVLGISLGQSAVYALLSLINKLTQEVALNRQTTSINTSKTPDRPWLDLAYQVANLVFPLVPVALVLYLLWVYQRPHGGPLRSMGFDLRRPGPHRRRWQPRAGADRRRRTPGPRRRAAPGLGVGNGRSPEARA